MTTYTKAQNWLDTTMYPFEHQTMEFASGKMHYVDEGKGPVLLFIHGTPTWSFLYRDFIKALSQDYRCIAVDHLGFGLSEKPEDFSGTPQAHTQNLVNFIRELGLQDITLLVHDFGGPIGLGAAIQEHERIRQIVLFNSFLWATKGYKEARKVDKVVNSWLGRFLYLNLNFSPRYLLKQGFTDKRKLTKAIHRHYLKPFPNKASRKGLLKMAKALVGESDWYQEQWKRLAVLEDKPWLILWGTKDHFFDTTFRNQWQERLPQATVKNFDCGHFVQEEATEPAIRAIQGFLEPEEQGLRED